MGKKKHLSRQVGLEVGLILCRYLLKTDELHFGFWPDDLPVEILNLPVAQENHSGLIIDRLPIREGRILDVGCGSGSFGRKLIDMGYHVDGVIPSAFLAEQVRKVFGGEGQVFECRFEDLETEGKYDLVLFSESFQYVEIEAGLAKAESLLEPGGRLLICDFFDKEVPGKKSVKGGHKWSLFEKGLAQGSWQKTDDFDMTRETGRTLDLVKDAMTEVGVPICVLLDDTFRGRHPLLSKLLHWKFRKRLEKAKARYLSGRMSGEFFEATKTYRFLVFEKA